MKSSRRMAPAAVLIAVCWVALAQAPALAGDPLPEANDLGQALGNGEGGVVLRYRIEHVHDQGFDKKALASTLRTALFYQTRRYKGIDLFLEAVDVSSIGGDTYNNLGAGALGNGYTDRPVIPDPALTQMNQAFLRYTAQRWNLKLGRHEINLDNQRFVGTVPWRQNHQSFNAARLVLEPVQKIKIDYSYSSRVHRVTGGNQDAQLHFLNANWNTGTPGSLALYGYWSDFDDEVAKVLNTATYGGYFAGKRTYGKGGRKFVDYRAEYAYQTDASGNPAAIKASYIHAVLSGGIKEAQLVLGYEVLGGSPEDGRFTTSFATLHKFNGWVDKFLVTPENGLRDFYVALKGEPKAWKWLARYHRFDADTGDTKYGQELDLMAGWKAPWKQEFYVTAGFYKAESEFDPIINTSADTDKFWFWTSYSF